MLILTTTKAVIMLTGIWHVLQCHAPGQIPIYALLHSSCAHSLQILEPPAVSAGGKPKVPYLLADEDLILLFSQPIELRAPIC